MAVMEQLGPANVATALVKDGKLVVIDGAVQTWTFQPGTQKDQYGDPVPGPKDAEAAFVINERLFVIDSSGVCWTYIAGNSEWAEGAKIDDKADPDAEDKELPWIKGRIIEGSAVKADELRRAKAALDAHEADKEEAKAPKKKKEKEPA